MSYHRRRGMGQVVTCGKANANSTTPAALAAYLAQFGPSAKTSALVAGSSVVVTTPTGSYTLCLDQPQPYVPYGETASVEGADNIGIPQGYEAGWIGGYGGGCPNPCAPPGSQPTPAQNAILAAGIQTKNPSTGAPCSCPSVAQMQIWGKPVPAGYPQSLFTVSAPVAPAPAVQPASAYSVPASASPSAYPAPASAGNATSGGGSISSLSSIPLWAWGLAAAAGLYFVVK